MYMQLAISSIYRMLIYRNTSISLKLLLRELCQNSSTILFIESICNHSIIINFTGHLDIYLGIQKAHSVYMRMCTKLI